MPYAPPSRCSEPGCGEFATERGRCSEHRRVGWQGRPSTQARYGISGSAQQKLHRSILKRDGYVCYVCRLPGADNVDHVIPIEDGGARTAPSNLAAIHEDPCHKKKTQAENARRREKRRLAREARQRGEVG